MKQNSIDISYAHITLRNGEKLYVAFEDEATKTMAVCGLPSCIMCKLKDIPEKDKPVHYWFYGDKSIKQVMSNRIAYK
jgi:hypothetical protein